MLSDRALHPDGFRPLSVPFRLRCSSSCETIIVGALNRCALNLEIGEALHLEGLSALNLELGWGDGFRLERDR